MERPRAAPASRSRPRDARPGHDGGARERLYGFHSVREALRARRRVLHRLVLRAGRPAPGAGELAALAAAAGVRVEELSPERLASGLPAEARHQGAVLEAGPLPALELEVLLAAPPRGRAGRRFVVLDGVEDPQNLGAIARSAEAVGADGLLLAARRAAPASPAASRASAGALEHLPLARVTNLARALDVLREDGCWVLAAASGEGEDLFGLPPGAFTGDWVVVLGAEGRGLRPGIASRADRRVRIPMLGQVESLNVSAAAAVLLYAMLPAAR